MIQLVPSKLEYAEVWLKWRSEPNLLLYNPVLDVTIDQLKYRMSNTSSDFSNLEAAEEFQLFIRNYNQLVGTVTLKNVSLMMGYGEIGYGVGEEFQGQGIGTQAVRIFVSKIFSETPLRRLFAYVAEKNAASRKLIENVGFIQEGICREHFIINGKPMNEVIYGLLRSDWEKLK